jgi:alpha-glucosidase/alpha-D-xyloside xylohydrolase
MSITPAAINCKHSASDPSAPGMSFLLGKGRLLGLGEGGPQFDRKGQNFPYRSGQGGYQLATHGGQVPIQCLIGTDGWAMFFHRPLGAFDLTSMSFTPCISVWCCTS